NPWPAREGAVEPAIGPDAALPKGAAGPEDLPVGLRSDVLIDSRHDHLPVPPVASPVQAGRDYHPLLTLAVAAFIAMLAGSVYLGWQRSVAGLPYSQQLWEKTVRLATWAGHGPRTGQTPAEFAQSLKRTVDRKSTRL